MIAVGAGCVQPELLVDDGWAVGTVDPGDDPAPPCEQGWWVEEGLLEVDTGLCDHLLVSQPLGHALLPGDVLSATLAHDFLTADDPAVGHVVIGLDGVSMWELEVPIPGAADAHPVQIPIAERVPAGTELSVHLHNHGANNWRLTPPRVE